MTVLGRFWRSYRRPTRSVKRVSIALCFMLGLAACYWKSNRSSLISTGNTTPKHILRASESTHAPLEESPVQWMLTNSNNAHAFGEQLSFATLLRRSRWSVRPRAALISLVRNEELEGIVQSMRQLEYHWNHKYQYPWIFFNEQPFSETFKVRSRTRFGSQEQELTFQHITSNLTNAPCFYEVVPPEHWNTPDWIDEERYMDSLEHLDMIGVGKGWMPSYRNMCRWNSGFFYKHPRLADFDFYWRVEPDVSFLWQDLVHANLLQLGSLLL